ncbi:DUF2309 domain-containing protein [Devosia sp. PTR5]|uniref:Probable inorganic carbon transporter subunit DabA n=1 Tax=Devosia oryzisoli TaxID=2774138 RepID=A0A927FTS2_9HYPH|nr:DUF2309 domain-containing protein [Devosia oryzisoli]MBD8064768.1 DUF2309 domain-containing protein [Devosia oryzisoli]
MLLEQTQLAPSLAEEILGAARTAARAIPPAFPLDATVAVNPFLGQTDQDLATASARLARLAGAALTRPRAELASMVEAGEIAEEDLEAALLACSAPGRPADLVALRAQLRKPAPAVEALPTIADLAAAATGTDWPAIFSRSFGLWASGFFDRGQALWTPRPDQTAFAAWREWAINDLTPAIAGLRGFSVHVASTPDTAERAILRATSRLGLTAAAAETAFHQLLLSLGGWSMHARWQLWQAELEGRSDTTLTDLLAIRLVWDEALLAHCPSIGRDWRASVAAHAAPVVPTADHVLDCLLQDAAERAHQRMLANKLTGPAEASGRPKLQAAFCIDVRSEVLRRALEGQGEGIETLGFAGFFGLPVAHRPAGTDEVQAHLPALLSPSMTSTSHGKGDEEFALRIAARTKRAWGRFRQAAVSSFAFVEAAGLSYGGKLIGDSLVRTRKAPGQSPLPRIEGVMSADAKAATAAKILRAMSLTERYAPLVLLIGHGAQMTNNPHESAYQCGACCGQTGEVSARLVAAMLNDPETRAGLPGLGLVLPDDTLFVAGLHDTVTDTVTLFPEAVGPKEAEKLDQAEGWLGEAGRMARAERAQRLPGAKADALGRRAADWAEVRPEWGLAGCAAFIAAPGQVTAGRDLAGRAFLHSYDWTQDDGFGTLDLILTAPVVVGSWISLQYYGSTVAPELFGGGNKLIHNVLGGIGVVEGNGGRLRAGLPWQAVHDGERLIHQPLRLSVMIEAPIEAISAVLKKHEGVRQLFDNGWMHLLALSEGRVVARYRSGLAWEPWNGEARRPADAKAAA